MNTSKKQEFKKALEARISQDGIEVNPLAIESALRKNSINSRNMDINPWDLENIWNARSFYYEFGKVSTYNREIAKLNR